MRIAVLLTPLIIAALLMSCRTPPAAESGSCGGVKSPGFEEPVSGWEHAVVGDSEYYAPVDGNAYAVLTGGAEATSQLTDHVIREGKRYIATAWLRSINPVGELNPTPVEMSLMYRNRVIRSTIVSTEPVRLPGDPTIFTNDDGGNVWVEDGYRMEFAEGIFIQPVADDPLSDPWKHYHDRDYEADMAVGPILLPNGLKGIYSTKYLDYPPFISSIEFIQATGSPPDYTWTRKGLVLSHKGSENPWVIDAHLVYDDDTGRLWMTWGGGTVYVSEMDPSDGKLLIQSEDHAFTSHPQGTHVAVARWRGDEWTAGNDWFEGAALHKHDGYWYFFASYGNLATNYTIRMGRGTGPQGPFYDKDGVDLMEWDAGESEYGNSFLLGADGGQDCPGHPHFWTEDGITYMGYDYVDAYDGSRKDRFGIREIRWVNGWPTIWTPVTLSFTTEEIPRAVGRQLKIAFRNVGAASTTAAVDAVSVEVEEIGR